MKNSYQSLAEFYPILLFTGYLNLHVFYACFGISIAPYLSTFELLFSFLTLSIPVVLFLMGLLVLSLVAYMFDSKHNPDARDSAENLYGLKPMYKEWLDLGENLEISHMERATIFLRKNFIDLIVNVIITVFFLLLPLIFIGRIFGLDFIKNWNFTLVAILGFIGVNYVWYMISLQVKMKKSIKKIFFGMLMIYFSFGVVYLSANERAEKLLEGNCHTEIQFEYKGHLVQTDSNLVYIGQTQDYLFLRDLTNGENHVYKENEIEFYIFKENGSVN